MGTTQILIDRREAIRIVEALALLVIDELLPGFCLGVSFSAHLTALQAVNNAVVVNVSPLDHILLPQLRVPIPSCLLPVASGLGNLTGQGIARVFLI